jgi:transcription termination/antitermination protein NusA
MKSEFALAFNEVVEDRQLSRDVILEALESALVSAYRRAVNASNAQLVEAKVNMDTGEVEIYAEKEVVEDVQDERTEVLLSEARKVEPEADLGDMVVMETTPEDFGRVAAQTARQVIQQRIREAEREIQFDYYQKQVGEIVSGIVQAVTSRAATIGLDKKAEGTMLRKDMIPRERLRVHDRIRCLVYDVKESNRVRRSTFHERTEISCAAYWKTRSRRSITAWLRSARSRVNPVSGRKWLYQRLSRGLTR